MKKILHYNQWKETAQALHMLLQMMGKTKLQYEKKEPEWAQSLLEITGDGFSTGLIRDKDTTGFEVRLSLHRAMVRADCTSGLSCEFSLRDGASVADYYANYVWMLESVKHPCSINTKPQEVPYDTTFEKQTTPLRFNRAAAIEYFHDCVFARNTISEFTAPLRCKKIRPSLFWGTFDMTCVLFSGEGEAFPGKGLVEKVAFDEKLIECGFWPGDDKLDEPHFFTLGYPFPEKEPEDTASGRLKLEPEGAIFSDAKKEYFLPLSVAMAQDNPGDTVCRFFAASFTGLARQAGWKNLDWIMQGLAY